MIARPEAAWLVARIAEHATIRAAAIREVCVTDRSLRWEFDPLTATAFELMNASPVAGAVVAGTVASGLWRLARNREARQLLERAIEIEEKHFDDDHPNLAVRYSNLALVLNGLGGADNLREARRLLERAIEIEEKRFDDDHPTLAVSYSNLATVLNGLGGADNLREAKRLLERALASFLAHFGEEDRRAELIRRHLRNLRDL